MISLDEKIANRIRRNARGGGAKLAHFCSMCGPHVCSMKITQDVCAYANAQNIEAEKALAGSMSEKAMEFVATGGEFYHGNVPEGAKH